jgi:hypothetical protein
MSRAILRFAIQNSPSNMSWQLGDDRHENFGVFMPRSLPLHTSSRKFKAIYIQDPLSAPQRQSVDLLRLPIE